MTPPTQTSVVFRLIAIAVFPLHFGCIDAQLSAPATNASEGSAMSSDCQDDVDKVALCFYEAVTVLQREPEDLDAFAVFMKEAKDAMDESGDESAETKFDGLRWSSDGTFLIATTGKRILCRISKQTHDNYGPQGSSWLTEYEFYIPDSECQSQTTIELSMRQ